MRAIDILQILSTTREGYTLAELSSILDSPKSSVFDIMKTLVYKNMVYEDTQSGITKYKIGLQSFLIGNSYIHNIDYVQIAKNDLISFANKMQATTFMAVLDDNMVTYIYKYESEHSIITTANIGTRRSIHSAALGKAMIAFMSEDEQREAIANTQFTSYTSYTITDVHQYLKELEEVRLHGYAKDDRENALQQIAAAAPLFNHENKVVAAISCVGFYEENINLDDLGILVKEVADKISIQLGYTPQS